MHEPIRVFICKFILLQGFPSHGHMNVNHILNREVFALQPATVVCIFLLIATKNRIQALIQQSPNTCLFFNYYVVTKYNLRLPSFTSGYFVLINRETKRFDHTYMAISSTDCFKRLWYKTSWGHF